MRAFPAWLPVVLVGLSGCLLEDEGSASPTTSPSPSPPAYECMTAKSFKAADINITIETSKGSINGVLHGALSPITVCNFLRYAEEAFYDGTVWHRVCTHVIQAGGVTPFPEGRQKTAHEPIKNEANVSKLRNDNATFGMARLGPDSATSHFYINIKSNNYLDFDSQDERIKPGYAVFGNVTGGWSVVRDIADTTIVPDTSATCRGQPIPSDETVVRNVKVLP